MKLNFKFFFFYFQRTIRKLEVREYLAKSIGKIIGKGEFQNNVIFGFKYSKEAIKELNETGYYEFPDLLSDKIIQKLNQSVETFKLVDPHNSSFGLFSKNNIPQETHVANYIREDLVTISIIEDLVNDSEILQIVQEFLGAKPTISNINMWWSLIGKDKAKDAQLFHRDVDDLKFCKLFIYLTDVGPNDGPHTYVKHTSSNPKYTKIRRYSDEEIYDAFGKENVVYFTRPKGSVFIVDTYGFHKGVLPIDNNRLILQVQYSLLPIGIEVYKPISKKARFDTYVNRLLYKE